MFFIFHNISCRFPHGIPSMLIKEHNKQYQIYRIINIILELLLNSCKNFIIFLSFCQLIITIFLTKFLPLSLHVLSTYGYYRKFERQSPPFQKSNTLELEVQNLKSTSDVTAPSDHNLTLLTAPG